MGGRAGGVGWCCAEIRPSWRISKQKLLLVLAAFFLVTAARDPILVPEISQHEIAVQQGFTGAELLLYGAILNPDGTRAGRDYDIVVVLKGPTRSIILRQKQRLAGIWVNAQSAEFRSAPTFFAVASSRPVDEIVDDQTAAIYELGLPWLQLSPIGGYDPTAQGQFSRGLVALMQKDGFYKEEPHAVTVSEQVLYQVHIALPSNVTTGTYTAETFAITHGRVVASAISRVEVKKLGFELLIAEVAAAYGFA